MIRSWKPNNLIPSTVYTLFINLLFDEKTSHRGNFCARTHVAIASFAPSSHVHLHSSAMAPRRAGGASAQAAVKPAPTQDPSAQDPSSAMMAVYLALESLRATPALSAPQVVAAVRETGAGETDMLPALFMFAKVLAVVPDATTARTEFERVIATLLEAGVVGKAALYETLDYDCLRMAMGVTEASKAKRREVRARTRLHYTQTRFNLFREESEGFSKLLALLGSTEELFARESDAAFVSATVEQVLALAGTFRLDTNRVIELVLALAAERMDVEMRKLSERPQDLRLPLLITRLLDEFEPRHVGQVLGAVLQMYHPPSTTQNVGGAPIGAVAGITPGSSNPSPVRTESPTTPQTSIAGGPSAPLMPVATVLPAHPAAAASATPSAKANEHMRSPESLLTLVVVMIREGRATINELWPHLSPSGEVVTEKFRAYERAIMKKSKSIRSVSLVADVGPGRSSGTLAGHGPSYRDVFTTEKIAELGPFHDVEVQKLSLILAMIRACRWRDAMDAIHALGDDDGNMLDVASHPPVGDALAKLAFLLLRPVLHATFPEFYPDGDGVATAIADLGGVENGFAAPVSSREELFSEAEIGPGSVVCEMLYVLGAHARRSPNLLVGLCRLLQGTDGVKDSVPFLLMRAVVLPAMSITQSNAGLSNEVWRVLTTWPHTSRWLLYGFIVHEHNQICAVANLAAGRVSYEVRQILKRLTSDNARTYTHALAKITHGQALPAFDVLMNRIQGYPADVVTIMPVIEAFTHRCTPLSLDMLIYVVIDRMSDTSRDKLKEDGINLSQWYSTISLFLGLLLRRIGGKQDDVPIKTSATLSDNFKMSLMSGVMSFFFKKVVVHGDPLLITAFSEIVHRVSDIEIESNLTSRQVSANGGGPVLRSVVSGAIKRASGAELSSAGTIINRSQEKERANAIMALRGAFLASGLHCDLSVAVAQKATNVAFHTELSRLPLKMHGSLVDRAQASIIQLAQFFDAVAVLPNTKNKPESTNFFDLWASLRKIGVAGLVTDFGVQPSVAVALLAPTVDYFENIPGMTNGLVSADSKREKEEDDVIMSDAPASGTGEEPQDKSKKGCLVEEESDVLMEEPQAPSDAFIMFGEQILSAEKQKYISAELYTAFWSLKLSDLAMPHDLYEAEKRRITGALLAWEGELRKSNSSNSSFPRHDDITAERRRGMSLEIARFKDVLERLEQERVSLVGRQVKVLDVLIRRKENLHVPGAASMEESGKKAVELFLQECIIPRCMTSASDALFCIKFVLQLLEIDVPAINPAIFFGNFIEDIPLHLLGCTERDADNLGILVREVLTTLERWRSNKKVFEKEASTTPKYGFREVCEDPTSEPVRHEQYCEWLFKLHHVLASGLCKSMEHYSEYVPIRNTLSVLSSVADVFPKVSEHGAMIEARVETLGKSIMPAIRLSSSSILGKLKIGKARRLPQRFFKLKMPTGIPGSSTAEKFSAVGVSGALNKPVSASVTGATSGEGKSALNVSATEFRPSDQSQTRPGSRKASPTVSKVDAPSRSASEANKASGSDYRGKQHRSDEVPALNATNRKVSPPMQGARQGTAASGVGQSTGVGNAANGDSRKGHGIINKESRHTASRRDHVPAKRPRSPPRDAPGRNGHEGGQGAQSRDPEWTTKRPRTNGDSVRQRAGIGGAERASPADLHLGRGPLPSSAGGSRDGFSRSNGRDDGAQGWRGRNNARNDLRGGGSDHRNSDDRNMRGDGGDRGSSRADRNEGRGVRGEGRAGRVERDYEYGDRDRTRGDRRPNDRDRSRDHMDRRAPPPLPSRDRDASPRETLVRDGPPRDTHRRGPDHGRGGRLGRNRDGDRGGDRDGDRGAGRGGRGPQRSHDSWVPRGGRRGGSGPGLADGKEDLRPRGRSGRGH